jgi:hypothetical protein
MPEDLESADRQIRELLARLRESTQPPTSRKAAKVDAVRPSNLEW